MVSSYQAMIEGSTMEKRWSERKELNVGVDVYRHGSLLCSCESQDIGLGGTFLANINTTDVQKDTDVELIFQLIEGGHNTRHKINARVTRVSRNGMGLKFCDFDTGVFRSLQEIMAYQRQPGNNSQNHNHH